MADINNNSNNSINNGGVDKNTQDFLNEDGLGTKILNGFKNNISFLIVIAITVVFIFSGYIKIVFQFNDIIAVICGSILGILVGWCIKSLLGKQGLINGLNSAKATKTQNEYNDICKVNNAHSEYYPAYCEIKNEQKIKNYQTSILTSVNLKYSKFIAGEYDNKDYYRNIKGEKILFTKKQLKALEKARNPKIVYITPDYLTNEMSIDIANEKKEVSTKQYEAGRNIKTFFSALTIGTISGFFVVSMLLDSSVANLIWTSIQALIYISLGFAEYIRRYIWVTNDHVSYIKRRISYHNEFKNMVDSENIILFTRIRQYENEAKQEELEYLSQTNNEENENKEKEIINNGSETSK